MRDSFRSAANLRALLTSFGPLPQATSPFRVVFRDARERLLFLYGTVRTCIEADQCVSCRLPNAVFHNSASGRLAVPRHGLSDCMLMSFDIR